jgi:hypothetical protein
VGTSPVKNPDKAVAKDQPTSEPKLLTFDDRRAELRWSEGRWVLAAGEDVLKDFGHHEREARLALRAVREMRLNQRATIGTPQPIMEYWLSYGHPPTQVPYGLPMAGFVRESLRVEQIQGQWCVRDARQVLFNFGAHEGDARQALAVIKRYGFNQIGYLGKPTPIMIYFAGASTNDLAGTPLSSGSPFSRKHDAPEGTAKKWEAAFDHGVRKPVDPGLASSQVLASSERQLALPSSEAPGKSAAQERVPLVWTQIRVRHLKRNWELVYGDYVLADFGANEREAWQALSAVQYYRFTEQCLIGQPTPSFSYFLVNGHAPLGLQLGANAITFRARDLSVRKVGDGFAIVDGSHALMSFGDKEDEARQALTAIQQYRFDTLCRIGSTVPTPLIFLVRSR